MGVRTRRRRKIARRDTAPAATHRLPDELLELVFLRLPSSLQLIRAACTCKRWRRVVADGGFLRRFRSLHPHASVVGHYRVEEFSRLFPRPPGRRPVFFPSSASPSPSSDTVDARHFSLDFLPARGGAYWELADSLGGVLLFLKERTDAPSSFFAYPPDLVVCDPLTRRHSALAIPAKFHGCYCLGAFLLDGDADETGCRIGMSNFRVLYAIFCEGLAGTLVFSSRSSLNGDGWTLVQSTGHSGMPELPLLTSIHYAGHARESVYWMTAEDTVIVLDKATADFSFSSLPNDMPYVSDKATRIRVVGGEDGPVHIAVLTRNFLKIFVQAEGNSQWVMKTRIVLWRAIRDLFGDKKPQPHITMDKLKETVWVAERSVVLGTEEGEGIISMDLATMELKRVSEGIKYHGPAYEYQLPWPLTIRACLPL
jgi:hypothetical protein